MKNWTVKTKQIKRGKEGLQRHSDYLLSESHESHYDTEIKCLHGSSESIEKAHDIRTEQRRKNGLRGGGVRNLATSFVLSLPEGIKPTEEQWKRMMGIVVTNLSKVTGESREELAKASLIVLHNEKGNKLPHVHYLQSNIVNGAYNKAITQKRATMAVKYGFNRAVKEVMGIDVKQYKPLMTGQKDKPLWKAREDKAKEAEQTIQAAEEKLSFMELQKAELRKLKKFVTLFKTEIKKWVTAETEEQNRKHEKKLRELEKKAADNWSPELRENFIPYDDIEDIESHKQRKTGIRRPLLRP